MTISSGTGSKNGKVNGNTNRPTPKAKLATTIEIAKAVSGLTLKLKEIPSFPIIRFHHLLIYVRGLVTLTSTKGGSVSLVGAGIIYQFSNKLREVQQAFGFCGDIRPHRGIITAK